MNVGEIIMTATSAVGATMGASDMAAIMENTGEVSIPAIVVTVINCLMLVVNAGIAIYKKICALKDEKKKKENKKEEEEGKKNGNE